MSDDINRDMSLIEFERRVLEEARDERNPLLERIKFLGILGRNLDEFDLAGLLAMAPAFDAESVALLESYLDRRFPAWRQNAQGDAAGGQRRAPPSGKMTDEEAYQILGLQPGASRDEIGRAHRALMKKLHPDQGGPTYLAARVNQAKDTLLRTHLS